jgi:hypothetical protein
MKPNDSVVIYTRVPARVRDAVVEYAATRAWSMSTAVAVLIEYGLVVAQEIIVRQLEREQILATLQRGVDLAKIERGTEHTPG